MRALLLDDAVDPAFAAEALALPSESTLADRMEVIAVEAIHEVREAVKATLGVSPRGCLHVRLRRQPAPPVPTASRREDSGRRSLKNLCLSYLMELDDPAVRSKCRHQLEAADNMTDALAALACFADARTAERDERLAWFETRWKDDPLVLDKWFSLQATSRLPDTLDRVRKLTRHPGFDLQNPNRVRAVIGAFCHAPISAGSTTPRARDTASSPHTCWPSTRSTPSPRPGCSARRAAGGASDETRGALLRGELERILAAPGLSKDCYEVAGKFLA